MEVVLPRYYDNNNTLCSLAAEGNIGHLGNHTTSTSWPLAKLVVYHPVSISRSVLVNKMAWVNALTVDASGHVQAGVYDEAFNLLGSTASTVPTPVTAAQSVSVTPFWLQGGRRYYFAITCDSLVETMYTISGLVAGTTAGLGFMTETTSSFGLGNPGVPTLPTTEFPTWVYASSETAI